MQTAERILILGNLHDEKNTETKGRLIVRGRKKERTKEERNERKRSQR